MIMKIGGVIMDYSTINTELTNQWNTGVIAKPTIYNGDLKNTSKYPNTLFISMNPGSLNPVGTSGVADIERTNFFIKIIAKTRSDLDKFYSEIRRIVHAKSISGGHWRIRDKSKVFRLQKRFFLNLTGEEILFKS